MQLASIALLAVLICTAVLHARAQSCVGQGDIIFVIDGSTSVNQFDPSNFGKVKSFINQIVDAYSMSISLGLARFGLMRYSSPTPSIPAPVMIFDLNNYTITSDIKNGVSSMNYTGGGTDTHAALFTLYSDAFTAGNGDRPGINNIGIVITDGKSTQAHLTLAQAAIAKGNLYNITMFAIGVTNSTDQNELTIIASEPNTTYKYYVETFDDLGGIVSSIVAATCVATGTPSTGGTGGEGSGLTTGEKIGIGVGVTTGVLLIGGLAVGLACCGAKGLLGKRRKNEKEEEDDMNTGDIGEKAKEILESGGTSNKVAPE